MSIEIAQKVADAVLYEGYVLYPYRASARKNRVRWQFGIVAPRAYAESAGTSEGISGASEPWATRTECLMEPEDEADVRVRVRFLQLQARTVEEADGEGHFGPVESLEVDGQLLVTWDEAVERQVDVLVSVAALLAGERVIPFSFEGGEELEPVGDAARLVRRHWPISGRLRLSAQRLPGPYGVVRLRVETENTTAWEAPASTASGRDDALRRALVGAHSLLGLETGRFISLVDPPEWAKPAAAGCSNLHTWPVLVGSGGRDDVVLSSPIILYDHPEIAPESPGDLFDATEIDEILSLRTLALTDEEKAEARATDPRAAAVIDRVDTMPEELWARLHGAMRSLRPARGEVSREDVLPLREPMPGMAEGVPWWDPGADASVSPGTDSLLIRGVPVAKGSRVRLCPGQREAEVPGIMGAMRAADAQDLFLEGRTAEVQAVFFDVDGEEYLAVTLEDDPGAEIQMWHGRFFYFRPDEVEPLEVTA
jgi:hypothetical protein